MKKVKNQECHHLKKYDKLVNRTKKEAYSQIQRTNQWLPVGRGKGEGQRRIGVQVQLLGIK